MLASRSETSSVSFLVLKHKSITTLTSSHSAAATIPESAEVSHCPPRYLYHQLAHRPLNSSNVHNSPYTALKSGNSPSMPFLFKNPFTSYAVLVPCNCCPFNSLFATSSTLTPLSTLIFAHLKFLPLLQLVIISATPQLCSVSVACSKSTLR